MLADLLTKIENKIAKLCGRYKDYREYLFKELLMYLKENNILSTNLILEIGPKDGKDTNRLLKLNPQKLVLIDLPEREQENQVWLKRIENYPIDYISANFMYTDILSAKSPFNLIWCTGVLYHNPEQLRMIRRLYDLLLPQGILVIESTTTKNPKFKNENCVEILYPPLQRLKKKYHISYNITHLPSSRAIKSWLEMIGFSNIVKSNCHRRQSFFLAQHRVAFICNKPKDSPEGSYYSFSGKGYLIGKSL